MGGSIGFDEDIIDAGGGEGVVDGFHRIVDLRFGGAGAEPEEMDLFVEGFLVGEDTVVGGFEIEVAHGGAECADPGEFVEGG